MDNIINTIEIALLIMLPLIVFYRRSAWKLNTYIFIIPILYVCWYLSYGLLHELMHMFGVWILGKKIIDFQLFPRFWTGDFGTGFVKYNFEADKKDFVIIILPYIRDIIFLFIGYLILKKKLIKNVFLTGLILVILIYSSLYDIANNYLAYLFGALNDFNALCLSSNIVIANTIGIVFLMISMFFTYRSIIISDGYPNKNFELESQ